MKNIQAKLKSKMGPIGQFKDLAHGYFSFPKITGEISNKMYFKGKEVLCWSLNNYLGLGNHPEIRKADADASAEFGLAYPMGARMMSGNSDNHEAFEEELASFAQKDDCILLNYGFQGCMSAIEALVDRNDVIVYDAECHACIVDGARLHLGKRIAFRHNDMEHLETQLKRAHRLVEGNDGGVLVISEGVFGMSGNQGKLKEITDLKDKYDFTLFVDDAHGVGVFGKDGAGTGSHQGVQDKIDVYFGTFAKSFASIGGYIASNKETIDFLRYNTRSQIYAKALPMPLVQSGRKRLDMIRKGDDLRENLWKVVNALQGGLREMGIEIGSTNSPVTPVYLSGQPEEAAALVYDLRENFSIFCSAVVYPVVPKGTIILRLIPTAEHTLEDVEYTIETFGKIKDKLFAGDYKTQAVPTAAELK